MNMRYRNLRELALEAEIRKLRFAMKVREWTMNREGKESLMTTSKEKKGRNEETQRATFIPPRLCSYVWSYKGLLYLPQ